MARSTTPDGIERRHIHPGGRRLQEIPLGLVGIGLLLGVSVFGVYGGERQVRGSGDAAALAVDAPARIRNGEFFEMVLTIDVGEAVEDLVVRVDQDVWRDVTVNTFFPAAAEETHADGAFVFRFGPFAAGSRFAIKIDCQVNPDHTPSTNRGTVAVADGDGPALTSVEYALEVLP